MLILRSGFWPDSYKHFAWFKVGIRTLGHEAERTLAMNGNSMSETIPSLTCIASWKDQDPPFSG